MQRILYSFLIAAAVSSPFTVAVFSQDRNSRVQELFVPQVSEFTQDHPGVVNSFDLSPDGETLAVEFGTRIPDTSRKYGKFGIWVALWSIKSQHLVAARQVEEDLPIYKEGQYRQGLAFASYEHKVRFSPDGRTLIVLTGPRLVALSFPELEPMWAQEDPVEPDSNRAQMVFTDFSVSSQSGRVAILRQYMKGDGNIVGPYSFEVLTVSLEGGNLLGRWSKPGHSDTISLSPDGTLVALALTVTLDQLPLNGLMPVAASNVLVVKLDSGEILKSFNTGPPAGDAQFLSRGKELVTVPADHGSIETQWYLRGTVKFWNLTKGQMDRELTYPKYGVRSSADMGTSADGEWLAVANPWHNPADIKADRDVVRGWVRILVWHVPTGTLVYESDDLGQNYRLQGESGRYLFGGRVLVRISGSGNRLAVGGELITVYSINKDKREVVENIRAK